MNETDIRALEYALQGRLRSQGYPWNVFKRPPCVESEPNTMQELFEARKVGNGVWKWKHYLDIYDRHFKRFRGQEVHLLEIGVNSGGSLELWRDYFGPRAHIYGVDIDPACKIYDSERVKVFIGDQSNRAFWEGVRTSVGRLDIVIDDGSHVPDHQMVAVEELLPFLQPGGIYMCEDVHCEHNAFMSYIWGMADRLHAAAHMVTTPADPERSIVSQTTPLQSAVDSIAVYPYAIVIERRARSIGEFVAQKQGNAWNTIEG